MATSSSNRNGVLDTSSDGRVGLIDKLNALAALLKEHGIQIPDDVEVAKPPKSLLDLPNELLLDICRCVIYTSDVSRDFFEAGVIIPCTIRPGEPRVMSLGFIQLARMISRLSINKRIRNIAQDELFSAMSFSINFGRNHGSRFDRTARTIVLPPPDIPHNMRRKVSMEEHLTHLLPQVRHLEIRIGSFNVVKRIFHQAQRKWAMMRLVLELREALNEATESVHCVVDPGQAMPDKLFDAPAKEEIVVKLVEEMRTWSVKKRTLGAGSGLVAYGDEVDRRSWSSRAIAQSWPWHRDWMLLV